MSPINFSNIRFSSEEEKNSFEKDCAAFSEQLNYCKCLEQSFQRKDLSPGLITSAISITPSSSESDLDRLNSAYERLNAIRQKILDKINNK